MQCRGKYVLTAAACLRPAQALLKREHQDDIRAYLRKVRATAAMAFYR
jgi:hypothetical protein